MADTNKRPSHPKGITPKGTFVWPRLNAPDTKFKPEGEYSVKLRLTGEQAEPLIERINKAAQAGFEQIKAELEQKMAEAKTGADKGKLKTALSKLTLQEPSVKAAYDDEGNETGDFEFAFKMPASGVYKTGPKKGQKWTARPDVFDAKGKKLEVIPDIWGGTVGYVAFELRPYYTPASNVAGVSLRLTAVKLIEVVSGGQGRDANAYGFGGEEEGFEGSDAPAEETFGGDDHEVPAGNAGQGKDDF